MTTRQSPFRDEMQAALERVSRLEEENARLRRELLPPDGRRRGRFLPSPRRGLVVVAAIALVGGALFTALDPTPAARAAGPSPLDRAAISSAFESVDFQSCATPGVTYVRGLNDVHLRVTFAPDGHVSQALVDTKRGESAIYDGTPIARCIVGKARSLHIPAFAGGPVSVGKTVRID